MATIQYRTLNSELKRAIVNKQNSEDQLREIAQKMKNEKKSMIKRLNIVMIIVAVLFIVMGIPAVRNVGDPKFAGMMAAMCIGSIVVIYAIIYFLMVGILNSQFNGAVKKYYPEIAGELKV